MKSVTPHLILYLFIMSFFGTARQDAWAEGFLVPLFDAQTDNSLAEKSRLATQLYPEDSRLTVQVRIDKAGSVMTQQFYDLHPSELMALLDRQKKKGQVLEVLVGVDSESATSPISAQSLPDTGQLRCVKRMLFDDFY
jgi:hypothetical protein